MAPIKCINIVADPDDHQIQNNLVEYMGISLLEIICFYLTEQQITREYWY